MSQSLEFRTNHRVVLSISDQPIPRVLIVSHERSGTHFLMNSIAANMDYLAQPWVNIDFEMGMNFHSGTDFGNLFRAFQDRSVKNLFKSHHASEFYADFLPSLAGSFKVLHIYRDCYSTLASYHRFIRNLRWNEGPKSESLQTFLRNRPAGGMTRYQYVDADSVVERWCNHVVGWRRASLENPQLIMSIDYHELDVHFDKVLQQVAGFIGVHRQACLVRPNRTSNVVMPSSESKQRHEYESWYENEDREWIRQRCFARLHSVGLSDTLI